MLVENIADFRASYNRCMQQHDFIDQFHHAFVSTSIDAQRMFAYLDIERQKKMLSYAIYLLTLCIENDPSATECLEVLGNSHNKQEINPELYDHWVESLISAVSKCDSSFNQELEHIWRDVMNNGIKIMKNRYASKAPEAMKA